MPTIVTGGGNPQENKNVNVQGTPDSENVIEVNNDSNSQTSAGSTPTASQIVTPTIVNTTVPVVVFVGPPSSGKSMILVRLSKYLRTQGYTIRPDTTFLNTPEYQKWCEEFMDKLNTNIALKGTVEFLLVKVYKNGREIAKLLEAPGEDFYTTDPEKVRNGKNKRIEPYLSTIMTSNNPKSYVMLLDLDSDICFRNDSDHRTSYSQRFLDYFYPNIDKRRDRIVLLYNKIDATPYGTINGCIDLNGAKVDAKSYYPNLFATMKIHSLGGFFTSENFVFKTFCTGMFSKILYDDKGNEYKTYDAANDIYPKELWKEITRRW